MKWIASAAFGMEGLTGRDLKRLGAEDVRVLNVGGAEFSGTLESAMKANLWLRCADRVMLLVGRFEARSFEELFISLRHGQLKHIVRSVRNRILKLAGRNRNV